MLTSISPLGERARGHRWAVTTTAYVVGSLLGGLSIGALLGAVGRPLPDPGAIAAGVCLAAAALDLRPPPPSLHRQVDQAWLTTYRGWVYGLGFGYQLGLGVVTIVTSAATYAALGLCLLSGGAVGGAVVGGTFGLVRALPLLLLRGADSPAALHDVAGRLDRLSRGATRATVAVLAGAAAVLAVTA